MYYFILSLGKTSVSTKDAELKNLLIINVSWDWAIAAVSFFIFGSG